MRGQLTSSQFALCYVSCKFNQAVAHLFFLRFFELQVSTNEHSDEHHGRRILQTDY